MSTEAAGSTPGQSEPVISNFFSGMTAEGGSPIEASPGSSTAAPATAAQTQTLAPPAPATVPAPSAPAAPTTTAAPAAPAVPLEVQGNISLSPQQLAELAQNLGRPAAPLTTPKELTPEEIDRKYAVVRPTEEQLSEIFAGGPKGVATLTSVLHDVANMGANIAAHHVMGELAKLQAWTKEQLGGLAPAREVAQERLMDHHQQQFFTQFSHWKPEHTPVLKQVYDNLVGRNFKGTAEEVYKKINEEALVLMRVVNPQFGASVAGATGTPGQTAGAGTPTAASRPALQPSQMTTLPTGGSGGNGSTAGSSAAKTGPQALFE